jgi:hypothetical protein
MTFAEIRVRARVSHERSARQALQGMVNHGVVIATGSGGKGHPRHYSMGPLIANQSTGPTSAKSRRRRSQQISPRIEMVVNADTEDILVE